jgi:hypothetical protein
MVINSVRDIPRQQRETRVKREARGEDRNGIFRGAKIGRTFERGEYQYPCELVSREKVGEANYSKKTKEIGCCGFKNHLQVVEPRSCWVALRVEL